MHITSKPFARRAFLSGAAAAGAMLGASSLFGGRRAFAQTAVGSTPTDGDVAVLKFLAAAELIETDLWQQYAELASNNPKFRQALQLIDPALPAYVNGDFYDEDSHAQFINAYLESVGQEPVDLDAFRTLPSAQVQGALDIGRLTSLTSLTVDTSYYNRYRNPLNPDFGDAAAQIVELVKVPAIPTAENLSANALQGIAQTAAFHFAAIEQGGSSLYNNLLGNVTSPDAVGILASIGPTEVYHFSAFMTSLAGIFGLRTKSGLTFPSIRTDPTRGQITPKPCQFLDPAFPLCSVIRPRSTANAGAVAAVTALGNSGLFQGQSEAFFNAATALAQAADAAVRGQTP